MVDAAFWRGKRVFLTGHTGFKGGWLALWLCRMGAEVHGFSLAPTTSPNLFTVAGVEAALAGHLIGDIRDGAAVAAAMAEAAPDIVLHLAAQPLVRQSYADPVETYATNVMGTVHVLDAVRKTPSVRAVVNVTTDKCYENHEWIWPYRETDGLGGHDPYSNSKACSELVSAAFRSSYFAKSGPFVATARAGNVIGGGDWAADRLVPDFLRALDRGEDVVIRSPGAVRPWQHVLEPLSGYLALAEQLYTVGAPFAEGWNFGPEDADARSVSWIADQIAAATGLTWRTDAAPQPHEANVLKLDSTKAHARLHWTPRWRLGAALTRTLEWRAAWRAGQDMAAFSLAQIAQYERDAGAGAP